MRCNLLKHSHRRRLIIDEDAPLAAAGNLTPQYQRVILRVQPVCLQDVFDRPRRPPPSLPNPAATTARSAPVRITSEEALSPSNSPSASIKIDFPAPVSPV